MENLNKENESETEQLETNQEHNLNGVQNENEMRSEIPGHIRQSLFTSKLFGGVMIAYWDNVLGPVIEKVWHSDGSRIRLNNDIVTYISNHTLGGELCRQTEKQSLEPILYIMPDQGYVFFAIIFNGFSSTQQTIMSATFIMAHDSLETFLRLQQYTHRQLKMATIKYRVLQQQGQRAALRYFSSWLKHISSVIDSLEHLSLPTNICLNETIFGETDEADTSGLLDSNFLMKAITTHIQTCGCTVVVGKDQDKINLMIRTLALFLTTNERYCSRLANQDTPRSFARDLYLQGIFKDGNDSIPMDSTDILLNTYPVTLIDVDNKSIKQTPLLNEHGSAQKEFLKVHLSYALKNMEAQTYPFESLFSDKFGDISIGVQHFISELFRSVPNKCTLRKNIVESFKDMLEAQANALIAYVEARSDSGRVFMKHSHVQQMQQQLLCKSQADFRIILALAEKRRPGLAVFLLGELFNNDNTYKNGSQQHVFILR